MYIIQPLSKKL